MHPLRTAELGCVVVMAGCAAAAWAGNPRALGDEEDTLAVFALGLALQVGTPTTSTTGSSSGSCAWPSASTRRGACSRTCRCGWPRSGRRRRGASAERAPDRRRRDRGRARRPTAGLRR
ncbi:hypothetical protein ACFSM7_00510 [Clavibacter michiganensis subsp. tessellarius]|uniref:hypothetical protein n=1 Tax=Clavibacter tessellarius TaxID=31965 RepID=UPI003643BD5C